MASEMEEAVKIAESLLVKTRANEIEWDKSPEEDEYRARSTRFTYYIKSRDEDGEPPYRLQVYISGESGNTKVLEVTTTSEDREPVKVFGQLYDLGKRASIGLKGSLSEEVMKDLGLD